MGFDGFKVIQELGLVQVEGIWLNRSFYISITFLVKFLLNFGSC